MKPTSTPPSETRTGARTQALSGPRPGTPAGALAGTSAGALAGTLAGTSAGALAGTLAAALTETPAETPVETRDVATRPAASTGRAVLAGPILAGLACLLLAALPRHWLEASMLRHMLLQLPLLLAAGWLLAGRSPRLQSAAAKIDQHGVTGLTALLFVSAYWMIPRALELSINSPAAEAAKFASLLLLGALLPGSLKRANWIVHLFFLGNFSWMMAIAGIQYQNMPQQLCNAYLLDDQITTGIALVIASIAIAVVWCWRLAPLINANNSTQKNHHVPPATEPGVDRHAGPRIL